MFYFHEMREAVRKQCLLFFLRNYTYNYNEIYIYLAYVVYAGRVNLLAKVSEPFSHTVSVRRLPQKGVLGVHPIRAQNDVSRRVLKRDCREGEREQSIQLLLVPPCWAEWCAVWRCLARGGYDSSSCSAEPFEFVVLTSLTSAHIALVWVSHLTQRWKKCVDSDEGFVETQSQFRKGCTHGSFKFFITITGVSENFVPTFVSDYRFFLHACVLFNKYPRKSQDPFNIQVHAVVQLVEALRYKPEGCGFSFWWCHWNFSLT